MLINIRFRFFLILLFAFLGYYYLSFFNGLFAQLWQHRQGLIWNWPPTEKPIILELPWRLLLTCSLFILYGGIGRLIWKFFGLNSPSLESNTIFQLLLGHSTVCYLIWFLGRFRLIGAGDLNLIFTILALSVLKSSLKFSKEFSDQIRDFWTDLHHEQRSWAKILIALSIFIFIVQMISAHAPSVFRDDLSYHLYLPKAYLEMGKIAPPPFPQRQSFYHQIFNMPHIFLLAAGGELSIKLSNVFWSIILAGLATILVKLLTNQETIKKNSTVLIFLATWSLPIIQSSSGSASTDIIASTYILTGLLGLALHLKYSSQNPSDRLSSLGLALSALSLNKYTSISCVLTNLLLSAWTNRSKPLKIVKNSLIFGSFSLAVLSPLGFYLWKETGNPVYPIPISNLIPYDHIEKILQESARQSISAANFTEYVLKHILGGGFMENGPWASVIMAAGFTGFLTQVNTILIWIFSGFILSFFSLGESGLIARYILPGLCLISSLGTLTWVNQLKKIKGPHNKKIKFILAILLFFPGFISAALNSLPAWQLNLGFISRLKFLQHYYPSETWDMVTKINSLEPSSKIAVIDHHFTPYHYNDLGAHLWPVPYSLLNLNDPKILQQELNDRQITHVLFVTSQWRPRRLPSGIIWNALYIGSGLQCRWWEKENLNFLDPIEESSKSILFKFNPALSTDDAKGSNHLQ